MEDFDEATSGVKLESLIRADLTKIFHKYVLDQGRNYDRLENLVCSLHSDYDINSNKLEVIRVEDDVVSIGLKKAKGLSSLFRLTLVGEGGVCKIKRREIENKGKWEITYI